ncbi:hypothetical protein Pmani_025560 [Petrolisthes manimaculis]|uniref:Protein kinase domain-containing protein n=1 Tax=Petrolisthes manimaculis TaxID=1843537 RepID=A0AAE1TXJ5_9EUCA|nr:hypothetical protein Pmani_025560 [Petrolisthes manimaculis]
MTLHDKDLEQVLHERCPSVLARIVIMREVCRLVDAMHNEGFAHNDVCMRKVSVNIPRTQERNEEMGKEEKGTEIARTEDNMTKVMLFGVRFMRPLGDSAYFRRMWEISRDRETLRTRCYPWLAPELFTFCQKSSRAADVYSIGYLGRQLLAPHPHPLSSILRECLGPVKTRPSIPQLFHAFDNEVTHLSSNLVGHGESKRPS